MCGRYYRRSDKQRIAEAFRAGVADELLLTPNFNIAPTTFQPIIRNNRDVYEREMVLARWGLVPFFAKSMAVFRGFTTINARAETLAKAATWREPFKRRRCIVPVDGFYEWKKLDDSPKPATQPYAISFRSGEPMAFAGLWDAWKEPKTSADAPETWLQSFSIITTEANEIMSSIHNRMPVILAQADWQRWLDRESEAIRPLTSCVRMTPMPCRRVSATHWSATFETMGRRCCRSTAHSCRPHPLYFPAWITQHCSNSGNWKICRPAVRA